MSDIGTQRERTSEQKTFGFEYLTSVLGTRNHWNAYEAKTLKSQSITTKLGDYQIKFPAIGL